MRSGRAKSVVRSLALFGLGVAIGVFGTLRSIDRGSARSSQRDRNSNEIAFDHPIVRLDLERVPFDQAMEAIGRLSCDMVVDYEALRLAGFDRKSLVTLHCRYEPIRTVLEELSVQFPQGNPHPDFFASDGKIIVTAGSQVAEHYVVRVYDVRDLLPSPGLVGSTERDDYDQAVQNLESLLRWMDPPRAWYSSGISTFLGGKMEFYSGRLIVWHDQETQHELARFLEELRSSPPLSPAKRVSWSTSELTLAAETFLKQPSPDINTAGATLAQLQAALERTCDVHFEPPDPLDGPPQWNAGTPFNVSVHGGTLGDVLDQICSQPNRPGPHGYGLKGESIVWDPVDERFAVATRVYDVRDLLPAKDPSYSDGGKPNPLVVHPGGVRDEAATGLIRKIEPLLDRARFGNDSPTGECFGGYLVISDTWPAHHRVERLLITLREQHG